MDHQQRTTLLIFIYVNIACIHGAVHSLRSQTTESSTVSSLATTTLENLTTTVHTTSDLSAHWKSDNEQSRQIGFQPLPDSSSNEPPDVADDSSPETLRYTLPDIWKDFCKINEDKFYESKFTNRTRLTTIECYIDQSSSGIWAMQDLRESLEQFNGSNLAFSIDIQCDYRSNISLSHPMQIYTVYEVSVKGCVIMDYFAEQLSPALDTTPDSLRKMTFRDNVVMISVRSYIHTMKNVKYIKKAFDCTQDETIEYLSNRNTSYEFQMDLDPTEMEDLSLLGEQFMADVKRLDHTCNFRHLMVLDQGNSASRAIYHIDLMTENSFYDELLVFNFSYNYIKALDDQQLKWSTRFPKLEVFDLSHNEISDIYMFKVPLHSTNRVTTINLQYNNISQITVKDLQNFKDLPMMFIDLRNNPIDCNCSESMRELLRFIQNGEHLKISNLTDYSYIAELQCSRPSSVAGIALGDLPDNLICRIEVETEYFIVPLVCMSVAIVILVLVLLAILRYRQEINIILFTRFNIIVPCHARENFDSSKKYDAFVSYSSNEEEYVEKWFEELEKPNQSGARFKFCLHHRDFVPGRSIFENVAVSVESSRHTIILLSNHFLKSEYCMHEFKEAFRQSIMEQKRHLVIIMMEDIDTEKLPRDIKRCIKTFTYIRKDDYLFSERLVYALSVKQKSKIVKRKKQKIPDVESQKQPKTLDVSEKQYSSLNGFSKSAEHSVNKLSTGLNARSEISNLNSSKAPAVLGAENDLNKYNKPMDNLNPQKTEVLKQQSQKLEINITGSEDERVNQVEKKLSNDYDRSVSTDTGYGSYCEKLSPDVHTENGLCPPLHVAS